MSRVNAGNRRDHVALAEHLGDRDLHVRKRGEEGLSALAPDVPTDQRVGVSVSVSIDDEVLGQQLHGRVKIVVLQSLVRLADQGLVLTDGSRALLLLDRGHP